MFDSLLLFSIFVSLLAGQFARIELISSLANIYIHEFFIVLFIIYSVFRFGVSPLQKVMKFKLVIVSISLLFFTYFLSFFQFTLFQNIIAGLYLIRLSLYFLFGTYLFHMINSSEKARKTLSSLIYTFSILLLVTTTIQYVFYPNFWPLYPYGWDPHFYRASSAYFDIFIASAIYGMLAIFWYVKKQKILALSFVLVLFLSLSRSAYVAFAISALYFFVSQKKWNLLLLAFLTFILLIVVIPKPTGEGGNLLRTVSIHSRIQDYKRAFLIWQQKPLFGYGYNRVRFAKENLGMATSDDRSHSLSSFHSSFLIILVTTGITGLVVSIYGLIICMKRYPHLRVYCIYLVCMSLFDNVLLHALVILPVLFIAANLTYSSRE